MGLHHARPQVHQLCRLPLRELGRECVHRHSPLRFALASSLEAEYATEAEDHFMRSVRRRR